MEIFSFTFFVVIGLLSSFIGCLLIGLIFGHYFSRIGVYRSRDDKILGGVCGGIAQSFTRKLNVEDSGTLSLLLRISFVILIFGFGVSFLFYIFLWLFMKKEPLEGSHGC